MNSFKIEELENGNLKLSIDACDREELTEIMQWYLENDVLSELLESYRCNGGYSPVFDYGLTDAPGIVDTLYYDDNEDVAPTYNKLWWFPNYMLESFAQTLHDNLSVIFTKAE
jgi:hypothetical protein